MAFSGQMPFSRVISRTLVHLADGQPDGSSLAWRFPCRTTPCLPSSAIIFCPSPSPSPSPGFGFGFGFGFGPGTNLRTCPCIC